MTKIHHEVSLQERRKRRIRAKVQGSAKRPRLSVFRSTQHIYLQAINDEKGITLAAASESDIEKKGTKKEKAQAVAMVMAKRLKDAKVTAVVFDRGSYRYFGRVQAVAQALREAGIQV